MPSKRRIETTRSRDLRFVGFSGDTDATIDAVVTSHDYMTITAMVVAI